MKIASIGTCLSRPHNHRVCSVGKHDARHNYTLTYIMNADSRHHHHHNIQIPTQTFLIGIRVCVWVSSPKTQHSWRWNRLLSRTAEHSHWHSHKDSHVSRLGPQSYIRPFDCRCCSCLDIYRRAYTLELSNAHAHYPRRPQIFRTEDTSDTLLYTTS